MLREERKSSLQDNTRLGAEQEGSSQGADEALSVCLSLSLIFNIQMQPMPQMHDPLCPKGCFLAGDCSFALSEAYLLHYPPCQLVTQSFLWPSYFQTFDSLLLKYKMCGCRYPGTTDGYKQSPPSPNGLGC